MGWRLLAFGLAVALGGCFFDELDLSDRVCECAPGHRCVENRCVTGLEFDAGTDSGLQDLSIDNGTDTARDPGLLDRPSDAPLDSGADTDDASAADASMDASMDTMPMDAGAPECRPGWLLCDNFDGPLSGWMLSSGPAPTISISRAERGPSSLRVAVDSTEGAAQLRQNFPTAITGGNLYARFFIYIPLGTTISSMTPVALHSSSAPFRGVSFAIRDNQARVVASTNGEIDNGLEIARNRWVCVGVEINVANAGSAVVLIDGAEVASLSAVDTLPTGGINRITFGHVNTQTLQPDYDFFLDSLAVSTTPISCAD